MKRNPDKIQGFAIDPFGRRVRLQARSGRRPHTCLLLATLAPLLPLPLQRGVASVRRQHEWTSFTFRGTQADESYAIQ